MSSYCSQKFWWLTIEPERRQLQSCCAAYPHKIDTAWLKDNPGNLFNIPILTQERKDMLDGKQVPSCEATCWAPERQGKTSRRLVMESDKVTHTDITTEPEVLHILFEDRYNINVNDLVLLKLGQKKIDQTESYNLLIDEIVKYKNYKFVSITGGEPFLNNSLTKLLKNFTNPVRLYTGLGVNPDRLERILADIGDNVEFVVSAEGLNESYEFVRWNNSYERFVKNLELLQKAGKVSFSSVLSNLTIFNFKEFEDKYGDYYIDMVFCNEPDYLALNVLDDASKESLLSVQFKNKDNFIKKSLQTKCTKEQHSNLQIFLKKFVERRRLDLSVYPSSFVDWLNEPIDLTVTN
jgi:pyruvate-formate lyase-activating enzyme